MTKYYCSKCNKYHYRGKIYKNHLKFKRAKSDLDKYKHIELNEIEIRNLRPIAQRQIFNLLKKMRKSKKPKLYEREIKRVILFETKNY
jgi:hypothetical protein